MSAEYVIYVPGDAHQRATFPEKDLNNQVYEMTCPVAVSEPLSPVTPAFAQ